MVQKPPQDRAAPPVSTSDRDTLTLTVDVGLDAEAKTLCRLLANDPDADAVYARISGADFQDLAHRIVFLRCQERRADARPIEPGLIVEAIAASGAMSAVEANALIASLITRDAVPGMVREYADTVKMASILRALRSFGSELSNFEVNLGEFGTRTAQLERRFSEIVNARIGGDIAPLSVYADAYYTKLNNALENNGVLTGVQTGFRGIDRLTNGFQPGDLIILAARPGKGKTAFAVNVLVNAA